MGKQLLSAFADKYAQRIWICIPILLFVFGVGKLLRLCKTPSLASALAILMPCFPLYGFQDPLTHAVRFIIYLEAVTLATCPKSRKKIRQMPIVLVWSMII